MNGTTYYRSLFDLGAGCLALLYLCVSNHSVAETPGEGLSATSLGITNSGTAHSDTANSDTTKAITNKHFNTAQVETLEDAWNLALAHNNRLKAAEQLDLAARDELAQAKSQRLPSLVFSANYTVLDNPPTIDSVFAGQPFQFTYWEEQSLYYSFYSAVPLYTGGRISKSISAAQEQAQATRLDTNIETRDLKMVVAKAYVDVLRARQGLSLARSHVKSLEKHQLDVENLQRQGLVSRSDLLTANVALANAQQGLTRARHMSQLSIVAYNQILGRGFDIKPQLIEPHKQIPKTPTDEIEQLTALALEQREELIALKKRARALQYNASSVISATKPQVVLGGGYTALDNENQLYDEIWFANIGMVWTVFDGGSTRHRSNKLNRQAAALRAQHEELSGLIRLQVRSAWLRVKETDELVLVTKNTITQAEENLKVTRNRYREGLASHTEVLDSETLRIRAQSDHANARFDSTLASLQLQRATGKL